MAPDRGIGKTGSSVEEDISKTMSSLSSVKEWFMNYNKGRIDISLLGATKIEELLKLFKTTERAIAAIKKADKVAKAYGMAGREGSRYRNVIESYADIEKREQQGIRAREKIRGFQPVSWMRKYKEAYGDIEGTSIANLEYQDAMREITDPVAAERTRFERAWGYKGGRAMFKAQADKRFQYDMMDEYDRTLHDLTERYGGDKEKAEASYANMLKKELPSFFKNSKLDSKALLNISNGIGAIRGVPIIGKLATNPISAAIGAAMLADRFLAISDSSNKSVVGWQNAALLHGKPSKIYMDAALLAGMADPTAITKRLGGFALRYGTAENAEKMYLMAWKLMSEAKPEYRRHIAAAFGMDETDVAIAAAMSGALPVSEQRNVAEASARRDIAKTYGYSSGSGVLNTLKALRYSIPWLNRIEPRDLFLSTSSLMSGTLPSAEIERNSKEAYDLAVSDIAYQAATNTNIPFAEHAQQANRSIMFSIGNINVNADNAGEFIDSMKSEAQTRGGREVIESFDPKGF